MAEYSYTVLFEPLPEGGYQVFVPAMPEICTFRRTMEEAREMGYFRKQLLMGRL